MTTRAAKLDGWESSLKLTRNHVIVFEALEIDTWYYIVEVNELLLKDTDGYAIKNKYADTLLSELATLAILNQTYDKTCSQNRWSRVKNIDSIRTWLKEEEDPYANQFSGGNNNSSSSSRSSSSSSSSNNNNINNNNNSNNTVFICFILYE